MFLKGLYHKVQPLSFKITEKYKYKDQSFSFLKNN